MGGVKKIRFERTKRGRYLNKHPCSCMKLYGMDRCVASYDAQKDMMFYRGIPCEHCKAPINVWENEYHVCKDCWDAETQLLETNPWYVETIYNLGTPMHQEIKEYEDLDAWFKKYMNTLLGE